MEWNADWIWLAEQENMDNMYMLARREFTLDRVSENIKVCITAGSLYKLHINNEYIGRGPNPTDPKRYYYDVHDISAKLRRGLNTIAVIAYNYGPENHGVIGQNWGRGGLLMQMEDCGKPILCTDDSWKVIQAPQWDQNTTLNCTLYGDFKEIQDTRKEPEGWMENGFDDSTWDTPEVLGPPPVEPYETLVEREIPFLNGWWVKPLNVYWESASVTYAWRDDWEVYHEQTLAKESPSQSSRPAEIYKTHDDFDPSIILDFGRLVTGYPDISIQDSEGGIVDVLYGENLHMVRVDTFILKGGAQKLRPFNRRTFRYMKLLFRETPSKIFVDDVSMKMNLYPVEKTGRFKSDDPLLDRIWEVSDYTLKMSMLDHFVDCPWRERTIYGGDIYNENLFAQYGFGDAAMNRKVLRQMFAIQYPEGALPPYGPYRGCHGFYASWAGFTGIAFVDHYLFHGDNDFLDELWDQFSLLCDWACSEIERNDPPLIGNPERGGRFNEWMEGERVNFRPFDIAPFFRMLYDGARVAGMTGRDEKSEKWAAAAETMRTAVRKHMIDSRGLLMKLSSGKLSEDATEYDEGLYLWSGIPDPEQGRKAAEALQHDDVEVMNNPFGAFFLMDGLFRYGCDEQALDFTRYYYGDMLRRGATTWWEHFSPDWAYDAIHPSLGLSHCHGWGSGPLYIFGRWILGILPEKPGFEEIRIEPHLCGLKQAEGMVPIPGGEASVSWILEDRELTCRIKVPAGRVVTVSLPARGEGTSLIVNGSEETGINSDGRIEFGFTSTGKETVISNIIS